MPTKIKPERPTELPENNQSIMPDDYKEIIARAVREIGSKILSEHPDIKVRERHSNE